MNVLAAIISGLIGTVVITMVMATAPKMGMPKMDMVGMLGSMFGKTNRPLGMFIHLMMGVIFALTYAYFWSSGIGAATWLSGLLFGAVHWLVVGAGMGVMPMVHAGIKSGDIPEPGAFMLKNGGMKAFVGGLVGHMIFGIVVALVYAAF